MLRPSPRLACVLFVNFFALSLTIWPAPGLAQQTDAGTANDYSGPVRIAKLLWKGNAKNAASTLRNTIHTALDRGDMVSLVAALSPIEELATSLARSGETQDPRYAVAVAIVLASRGSDNEKIDLPQLIDAIGGLADRELVWRVWLQVDRPGAFAELEKMLTSGQLDHETVVALVQHALASDVDAAGTILLNQWQGLPRGVQVSAIEPMTSNAAAMTQLIAAVQAGTVSKDLINTNQLRKWLDANQPELIERIEGVWGRIRTSDNAARQTLVQETIALLRSGRAGSVSRGTEVFQRVCAQCHQLHGQGYEVGPNITGNGRGNLEQLVSNVLDPSLVIGEAFQAKLVLTTDGQVLSGLKVAETERYLKIKLQGGTVVELDKENDIEQIKDSDKSLMPEGLEEQLSQQELLDLFAYLSLLKPPGADENELIPGTPDSLVEP